MRSGLRCFVTVTQSAYGTEGSPNYGRDINGNNPFTSPRCPADTTISQRRTTHTGVTWITSCNRLPPTGCNAYSPRSIKAAGHRLLWLNGTTRCQQYGQFLGNRYRNSPNIIWNFGNDFQLWRTPRNDAVILAIADGLRDVPTPNHLITIQLDYFVSESQDDPNWIPRINTNGVYTYYPTYAETLVAPTTSPPLCRCSFLKRTTRTSSMQAKLGTPNVLRRQEYWSLTGGALAGHLYGKLLDMDRFRPPVAIAPEHTRSDRSWIISRISSTAHSLVRSCAGPNPHPPDGWLRHISRPTAT